MCAYTADLDDNIYHRVRDVFVFCGLFVYNTTWCLPITDVLCGILYTFPNVGIIRL